MDNLTCAQLITLGVGFHVIAGDWAAPICVALMVIAIVANWKRTTR